VARIAKKKNARRTNKPNPREDKNYEKFFEAPKGDDGNVHQFPLRAKKAIRLLPRNIAQERFVDALENEDFHVIFAVGSAGTGKSMLSTIHAIQGLMSGKYEKIMICRPPVGLDGVGLGFLPGDLNSKLMPWTLPILDVIKEYFSPQQVERMILNETISFISMEHLRGRTIKNAVLIFDEAQNTSKESMKTVLTRLGENARIIVTGDLKQVDRKYGNNGLMDFIGRLKTSVSSTIKLCEFGVEHVERHPVVAEILDIYGDED
jgi:phosphate starvation-inducible PhoH-like protein